MGAYTNGYTKSGLMRVFQILEEFRKIYPDMQMQNASIFVTIAMNQGITMKELGQRTGLAQSSCSRNVALLSEHLKYDKPGYGLVVATEDPVERRRKIVRLSSKGERVAASLDLLVREGQPLVD
ncbi:MarR family transcriptional regulator [Halomonas alkaliantarctica]|nr:MarR family transcriptional regulator [Halomonas alkaliantarctica]